MPSSLPLVVLTAVAVGVASGAFASDGLRHHVRKSDSFQIWKSDSLQNRPSNNGIDPNDPAAEALKAMGRHGC